MPGAERERTRLDLVLRQAASLIPFGRIQEVHDLLVGHEPTVEAVGDPALAGRHHFLLGRALSFLGEHGRAAASARRAIEEAGRAGDEATMGKAYCLLSVEDALSGQAVQGVENGGQAVALLERADEASWLGLAHWIVGLNHARLAEFDAALAAQARATAIGEEIGDTRLQTVASWGAGNVYAAMGEWDQGIAACERGLALSPDPLNTAIAAGWLGYAYLERGDPLHAIPLLERSTQQLGEFKFLQFHGWFTVFLADAYRLKGDLEQAVALARRGLDVMTAARFSYGTGWAQRVLGRIAHARGDLAEAGRCFEVAGAAFRASQARYDVGLTLLDVAGLEATKGAQETMTARLREARDLFAALGLPRYVERVEARARELGASL